MLDLFADWLAGWIGRWIVIASAVFVGVRLALWSAGVPLS